MTSDDFYPEGLVSLLCHMSFSEKKYYLPSWGFYKQGLFSNQGYVTMLGCSKVIFKLTCWRCWHKHLAYWICSNNQQLLNKNFLIDQMSQLNFLFILSHFKEKDGSPFLGALLKIGEKGGFDQIDSDLFEEVAQITCRGGLTCPTLIWPFFQS